MTRKRGNGEGSRPRKRPDGRWEARYTVHTSEGPKRKTMYGRTRQEVADKLATSACFSMQPMGSLLELTTLDSQVVKGLCPVVPVARHLGNYGVQDVLHLGAPHRSSCCGQISNGRLTRGDFESLSLRVVWALPTASLHL